MPDFFWFEIRIRPEMSGLQYHADLQHSRFNTRMFVSAAQTGTGRIGFMPVAIRTESS